MKELHAIMVTCGICGELVNEKQWTNHELSHMPTAKEYRSCEESVPCVSFDQQNERSAMVLLANVSALMIRHIRLRRSSRAGRRSKHTESSTKNLP